MARQLGKDSLIAETVVLRPASTQDNPLWFLFSLVLHISVFSIGAYAFSEHLSVNRGQIQQAAVPVTIIMPVTEAQEKRQIQEIEKFEPIKLADEGLKQKEDISQLEKPTPKPQMAAQKSISALEDVLDYSGQQAGEAQYTDTIRALLEKQKAYPRLARISGQQGTVLVRFTLNRDGRVTSRKIVQSSGLHLLDTAALTAVDKASPLPAFPDHIRKTALQITAPFRFYLR